MWGIVALTLAGPVLDLICVWVFATYLHSAVPKWRLVFLSLMATLGFTVLKRVIDATTDGTMLDSYSIYFNIFLLILVMAISSHFIFLPDGKYVFAVTAIRSALACLIYLVWVKLISASS
jgi:hypothetical protein